MKRILIATFLIFGAIQVSAQDYTVQEVGSTEMELQKESRSINFTAGNTHYFVTKYYTSPTWAHKMQSINADGTGFQSAELSIDGGVFGNMFSIFDFASLGGKAYAIIENYNSQGGERVLSARAMQADGSIAESGTDLLMINFEKTLRPGRLTTTVSPDGMRIACVGVLPFNKKASTKLKVAVYDENLKELSSSEFELDGLAIKSARYEAVVANDGTVYINRYTWKAKDGIKILVHQYDPRSSSVTETYSVEAGEGNTFGEYMYTTNPKSELVIAAAYGPTISITNGSSKETGMLIFRNEGMKTGITQLNDLDTPPGDFEVTGIYFSEETMFVTGEQAKEDKNSPANVTPTTANTTFTYSHESEYIFGFNMSGTKTFELLLDQQMNATNSSEYLYSSAHVVGGKLVYIYNDQFSKYRDSGDEASGGIIPVAVTVNPTGLMTPAVPFMNDLRMSDGYVLLTSYSQAAGNTLTFLGRRGNNIKAVRISTK